MMKLSVTAFLADLKPAVGFQTRQQLMNLDRHTPDQILQQAQAPATSGNRRPVRGSTALRVVTPSSSP